MFREALDAIASGIHRLITLEEQRHMTEAELVEKVNNLVAKVEALIAKASAPTAPSVPSVPEANLDQIGSQLDKLAGEVDAVLTPPAPAA